eukprot:TRINITY_DN64119_c0_g1_i1.p1 TRINITY_DN64119_c0_g1~~TRINITY_DN64119_c0_g1_i1.p1  ORF type:complete len:193 (+),score=34.05 TRINITY_DN64119_c0_g1_i1:97-675(+)
MIMCDLYDGSFEEHSTEFLKKSMIISSTDPSEISTLSADSELTAALKALDISATSVSTSSSHGSGTHPGDVSFIDLKSLSRRTRRGRVSSLLPISEEFSDPAEGDDESDASNERARKSQLRLELSRLERKKAKEVADLKKRLKELRGDQEKEGAGKKQGKEETQVDDAEENGKKLEGKAKVKDESRKRKRKD